MEGWREMMQATITCPSGQTIRVEVARTERERAQGLSGRAGLAPGTGMLLAFPVPNLHSITMRGMLFPIEVLWLDAGKTIFCCCGMAPSFPGATPNGFASYALELPAGDIQRLGLRLGDVLRF
jgi:uncharacterized protein